MLSYVRDADNVLKVRAEVLLLVHLGFGLSRYFSPGKNGEEGWEEDS